MTAKFRIGNSAHQYVQHRKLGAHGERTLKKVLRRQAVPNQPSERVISALGLQD